MINPALIALTLHRAHRSHPGIYLGCSPSKNKESFEEYEKRRAKEAEQQAKILFYSIWIGFIAVITLFVLSTIYHA